MNLELHLTFIIHDFDLVHTPRSRMRFLLCWRRRRRRRRIVGVGWSATRNGCG